MTFENLQSTIEKTYEDMADELGDNKAAIKIKQLLERNYFEFSKVHNFIDNSGKYRKLKNMVDNVELMGGFVVAYDGNIKAVKNDIDDSKVINILDKVQSSLKSKNA